MDEAGFDGGSGRGGRRRRRRAEAGAAQAPREHGPAAAAALLPVPGRRRRRHRSVNPGLALSVVQAARPSTGSGAVLLYPHLPLQQLLTRPALVSFDRSISPLAHLPRHGLLLPPPSPAAPPRGGAAAAAAASGASSLQERAASAGRRTDPGALRLLQPAARLPGSGRAATAGGPGGADGRGGHGVEAAEGAGAAGRELADVVHRFPPDGLGGLDRPGALSGGPPPRRRRQRGWELLWRFAAAPAAYA